MWPLKIHSLLEFAYCKIKSLKLYGKIFVVHIDNTPGTFQEFILLIFTCESEEEQKFLKKLQK